MLGLVAKSSGESGEVLGDFGAVSQVRGKDGVGSVDNRPSSTEVSDDVLKLKEVALLWGARISKREGFDECAQHELEAFLNGFWGVRLGSEVVGGRGGVLRGVVLKVQAWSGTADPGSLLTGGSLRLSEEFKGKLIRRAGSVLGVYSRRWKIARERRGGSRVSFHINVFSHRKFLWDKGVGRRLLRATHSAGKGLSNEVLTSQKGQGLAELLVLKWEE